MVLVSQGVTQKVKDLLGDRLTLASVLTGDEASPYGGSEFGIGSQDGNPRGGARAQGQIINIKALDAMGGGSYESIRDGISRATELGCKIMVLPIGAPDSDDGVTNVVKAALKKGILIVASAGNDSGGRSASPATLTTSSPSAPSNEAEGRRSRALRTRCCNTRPVERMSRRRSKAD